MWFINDFNLKKQAKHLGVKVWQTPSFLFIALGAVAIAIMVATFFISRNYDDPKVLVVSESLIVVLTMIIGNVIIHTVDQAVRLNRMKSEFVSVASHQLRTPLSAIKWEVELLMAKYKKGLSQKQLENIRTIESLSNRMVRLVNDLLDVAKIDQNRLALKKVPVNMVKIIREDIGETAALSEAKNIEVVFNCKSNMPEVLGDPERLRMVVENLLGNSIKYTPQGGKVELKVGKKGNFLIFSIKDNGVGIPREQQNRVFEKFFRSDNAVRYQTDGTGLGLYIAKNIVKQSGGNICFESEENIGTIFNVSLPVKS